MVVPQELAARMAAVAKKLVAPGKGLLAADEPEWLVGARFDTVGVENTERNRAAYRSMLFSTEGLGEHISGVILYEETLFQKAPSGKLMVDVLREQDIVPGIRVDNDLVPLTGSNGEMCTEGLDGLAERCKKYHEAGARFAKWRAALSVDLAQHKPSPLSIAETAHTLARYASICQHNGLVPIVEPDLSLEGDHTIETCAEISEVLFSAVFKALNDHNVLLECAVLKPHMVTKGLKNTQEQTPHHVAFFTSRTLRRTVPPALPGVVFLSGGQSETDATLNLNEINKINKHPWALSFCFSRALQSTSLKTWAGKPENVKAAQAALLKLAKNNSLASTGSFEPPEPVHSTFGTNYLY